MVVVAQLVRASDCDSEGRGFEPPRLPTFKTRNPRIPRKRSTEADFDTTLESAFFIPQPPRGAFRGA